MLVTNMKEAIVHPDTTVEIQNSPIPRPGPQDVLVKVVVAGTNPKDWKFPLIEMQNMAHNSGDDVAGVVEEVGNEVYEFRKGDRVAGMHAFPEANGAYAEYAVVPASSTFLLPPGVSFEQGASIPMPALTAAFALFYVLELPHSWQKPPTNQIPLIVYGASSAVGAYAIKLAVAAQIHPIIAIGSSNSEFLVGDLKPKEGDALLDYTSYADPEALVKDIKSALEDVGIEGGRAMHALDAISLPGTFDDIVSRAIAGEPRMGMRPKMAVVLPGADYASADPSVDVCETYCGLAHQGGDVGKRFSMVHARLFTLGLSEGWFSAHPYEVRQGLESLQGALEDHKAGRVRAKKVLLRITNEA